MWKLINNFSNYLIPGTIFGAVTETVVSVVTSKVKIVQSLSDSGAVADVVTGAAKSGSVLAESGPGLVRAGVELAGELIKVRYNKGFVI